MSEMELGNIIFGNSRGEYPIGRDGRGFEEELYRLFDAYSPKRDNSWREYGEEFENDVFAVMPYYWGECECGYEEREYEWCEKNKHRAECYQIDYHKIPEGVEFSKQYLNRHGAFLEKYIKPLYKKHGIQVDFADKNWWAGCAVICTCDYASRWSEFASNNQHAPTCRIVKPNFLYKPTGFEIQWYKYPLRDSYSNQPIEFNEFKKIIDACIASVA